MEKELEHKRHTLAHILAAAVLELYPHAKLTLGPAIDTGFYYDIDFSGGAPMGEDNLKEVQKVMKRIMHSWTHWDEKVVSKEEAREYFKDNPYKLELIEEIASRNETITLFSCGGFTDLCRGGHVENPAKEIISDAFQLDRIAGAYWRGNEKNPMLTRIYGLAFHTKEELDTYLHAREEAKKRDHRKLGVELDLFTFSELVGSGLPMFTPKGTILREEINKLSQSLREARGFQKVWVPHITKKDLYETSGHWDKFGDELFLVKSQETKDQLVMKPMNCPHHQQIYASKPRSYRDLPIRYLETTTIYRDEKAGELLGLSRVRSITQDDSHIFCTPEQIDIISREVLEMVKEFYGIMKMSLRIRLSFRDPENPTAYFGEEEVWEHAQDTIRTIAKSAGLEYFEAPGEAAFYGPKIDFMATDSIGREWQVATAQLDFVQPKRFGIEYTDKDGKAKTPVMIHLAIAGSLERFLSVYIEHTGGAFPLWLAPVQVAIIPVADVHMSYAKEIYETLKKNGVRVEYDDTKESMGKKIREAKKNKVPYFVVIGDKELQGKTLTLESRDAGEQMSVSLENLVEKLTKEIRERS